MATDSVWWHSPETVEKFPFPSQFKTTLEILSQEDYKHKEYFKDTGILALDVDGYERSSKGKGDNQKTVDAFIGICNEREGKRVNQRLLPVELRMAYKSDRHLDTVYLKDKLLHSCFLLQNVDEAVRIDNAYSLVFDDSVIHQMIRWLENIKRADSAVKQWQALSPEDLCNFINLGNEFPYTPKREGKRIAEKIEATTKNKNITDFEILWPEVRRYIERCYRRYEHGECRFLATVLSEAMKIFETVPRNNEEEKLMFELLKEEIEDVNRVMS